MSPTLTRRQLFGGALCAGVVTVFGGATTMGCEGGVEGLLPTSYPRDVAGLLRTLTLDDAFLLVDTRTGRVYRIDQSARTVSQLDTNGTARWTYGVTEDPAMGLSFPTDLAIRADGAVDVVDGDRVVQLSASGSFVRAITGFGKARSALVDAEGVLWVVDGATHQVKSFTADGTMARVIAAYGADPAQLNGPRGMALDSAGNLHVVDAGNAAVKVFSRAGALVRTYGSYGDGAGQLKAPRSVAVTANGLSYVADPTAGVVQVYEPSGAPLARLANLTMANLPAVPIEVSLGANNLVQVRLYRWSMA